ncbi:hypothetical protein MRB53_011150 [Persea americana]|uniref:Uncharacterized protein n=1 Tax=Persea americana TaxID=3435 RepID=A0ACC2LUK3_PERAE|nr:hypothetical protein MRB53_011150 [Persea americana]
MWCGHGFGFGTASSPSLVFPVKRGLQYRPLNQSQSLQFLLNPVQNFPCNSPKELHGDWDCFLKALLRFPSPKPQIRVTRIGDCRLRDKPRQVIPVQPKRYR